MNSIVVSTDSAMTILEPFTEQLWRLHQVQDHYSELESITITISQNILTNLAAESRERLFLCQGIISAMVCSALSSLDLFIDVAFIVCVCVYIGGLQRYDPPINCLRRIQAVSDKKFRGGHIIISN